ncbi:MAG: hypothetical protein LUC34_03000 [Campylobacter sp.]|nr:hypothetical protein [Campylobacter sp.]
MQELVSEILTMSIIFACIGFYAIWRAKKGESERENLKLDYDKNLIEFALAFEAEFEADIVNFIDLCESLARKNLILKFSKDISRREFVKLLKEENFKNQIPKSDNPISQNFVSECVKNLNTPLALGFYMADDKIFAFLCDKDKLLNLIDIASSNGDNNIICD